MKTISVQPLTVESFSAYGWLLGEASATSFRSALTDFSHEHIFDPGANGEVEILRVNYRNSDPVIASLEMHLLCHQTVIPLTGEIIQIVTLSNAGDAPDLTHIKAFKIPVGRAVCMRPACWHTTRVRSNHEVKCLMLTRASTTIDLAAHLNTGSPLEESIIAAIEPLSLAL